MPIERADIRERCTDAVFERGQTYREEGRISWLTRFGDRVTADVQGSQSYDVSIDIAATPFEATCTCPYDGPGTCKHVVAVLLDIVSDQPENERPQFEALLADVSPTELQSFLLDELARDPACRDRLRARFGDDSRALEAYRDDIDQLFDDHTVEYPVVTEAIDFSGFFEQAETYRSRDRYRDAAAVYRAIAEGIDSNTERVDGAYDHYARTFQRALDGYIECIQAAELSGDERQTAVDALGTRAREAIGPYAERYRDALDTLTENG